MNKKQTYLIITFLIIACCVAFGRIIGNDFINFDDPRLITENSYVQNGFNSESIKWALTDSHLEYWHPLTWLSIILNWQLFGANASGHHLVSLLLHIGAALFLFLFFNKATKNLWPSAFAAAIFALHPLRVESVAWASELKDVLSMFFGMATLYAYAYYVEKPRMSKYLLCLILFALSLMSKPMMVTLPFVLLLLDYWPFRRWQKKSIQMNIPKVADPTTGLKEVMWREDDSLMDQKVASKVKSTPSLMITLIGEKVPFFLLSIVSSVMLIGQLWTDGQMLSLQQVAFFKRIINAIISYVSYLGKIFWPVDLAVFYPYEHSFQLWQVLGSAFALLGISVIVIYLVKKMPFLAVGWFWYLGTLLPVIGLLQAGAQAMADRYTYLPSIGIAIMLAWGFPFLFRHKNLHRKVLFPVGSAVIATLVFLSWMQCGYWENSMTLFSHTLRVTKNNFMAHHCIALFLSKDGKINEAIYHYNEALRLNPNHAEAYNNRGTIYGKLGQYKRAMEDFSKAIHLHPFYADAYNSMGFTYYTIGQDQRAIEYYNKAITLKSDYALAYSNRAIIFFKQGNKKLCCRDAQKACALGKCKTLNYAKDKGYCR